MKSWARRTAIVAVALTSFGSSPSAAESPHPSRENGPKPIGRVSVSYFPSPSSQCVTDGQADYEGDAAAVQPEQGRSGVATSGSYTAAEPDRPGQRFTVAGDASAFERHHGRGARARTVLRGSAGLQIDEPPDPGFRCDVGIRTGFRMSTEFEADRAGRIIVVATVEGDLAELRVDADRERFDASFGYIDDPPESVRLEVPVSRRGGGIEVDAASECFERSDSIQPFESSVLCATSVAVSISFVPRGGG